MTASQGVSGPTLLTVDSVSKPRRLGVDSERVPSSSSMGKSAVGSASRRMLGGEAAVGAGVLTSLSVNMNAEALIAGRKSPVSRRLSEYPLSIAPNCFAHIS